jgi:hypothetical protein
MPITGFAPGTFVRAAALADRYRFVPGVDGEAERVRSRNAAARLTLTLLQSSGSNAYLSGLIASDRGLENGLPPMPLIVKTPDGYSLFFSGRAWLVKPADQEYSDDLSERVWHFDCPDAKIVEAWL